MAVANIANAIGTVGGGIVHAGQGVVHAGQNISAKRKQLKAYDEEYENFMKSDTSEMSIFEIANKIGELSGKKTKYIAEQSVASLKAVGNKATSMFGGVTDLFKPDPNKTKFVQLATKTKTDDNYLSDDHMELDYENVSKNLVNSNTKDTIMKESRQGEMDVQPGGLINNAIDRVKDGISSLRKSLLAATEAMGKEIEKNGQIDYFNKDMTNDYI